MMFYAVCNLDNLSVVSVESTERSAQDTTFALAHPAQPHIIPPVRNLLILPVESQIFVAYSNGKALELVLDDCDSTIVPSVQITQRRDNYVENLIRATLAGCAS